jgi:hypothetical protein
MKAFETGLFAATLLLVPLLAWLAGRAIGRRNWRIGSVIVVGCLMALAPHAARLAILASYDPRSFTDAFVNQISRAADFSSVGWFFAAFGIFMAMLGWTATPARRPAEPVRPGREDGHPRPAS